MANLPRDRHTREHESYTLNDSGDVAQRTVTQGTLTGEIRPSGLTVEGRFTEVVLNDTTWTALPPVPLTDRNALVIQNTSGIEVKLQYNPGQAGYVGIVLTAGAERSYDITDDIIVYGKSASGVINIGIEELA